MKSVVCLTWLVLALQLVLVTIETTARAVGNSRRSSRTRENANSGMCPEMLCPEISDSCETLEFLEMEVEDWRTGQVVRCRSCLYCIDPPTSLQGRRSSRQRRSATPRRQGLLGRLHLRNSSDGHSPDGSDTDTRPRVVCPEVDQSCRDVRMIEMTTRSRQPTMCPACFDVLAMEAEDNGRHRIQGQRRQS